MSAQPSTNALDRVIGFFSPERGLKRVRARMQLTQVRRYDAAASGRRTDSWMAQGTSANAEIGPALVKLRDRSRELGRNNPWAARARQAIVANTVGYGITAKVAGPDSFRERFALWAGTTQCDADGLHDLNGLEGLVVGTVVESGECLVRCRTRRLSDGLAIPMQLQVLEPDYLDHNRTAWLPNGGWIIQGVQFSPFGKREGYWLFPRHPGDVVNGPNESALVSASEVAHIFRPDRPGQVRGTPWGAPAMLSLRDLDDYEDAYLFRQKLANCQVGVIEERADYTPDPTDPKAPPLGEQMEPGRYDFLPSGRTIKFNTPPTAGDYGPFVKDVLLRVAAAYGITFQALTGDLTSVNFSSGRMGWIEMSRNVDMWRWQMLIPQLLHRVAEWTVEKSTLAGQLRARTEAGVVASAVKITWTPPRREMIDPVKEIGAQVTAIRSGLMPMSAAYRENGEDFAEGMAEYEADNKVIDKAGLVFDTDPRKVSGAGLTQARPDGTVIPSTDVE